MPSLLPIGDVSRRSGLSPAALRHYEEAGLIASQRSSGGQRRYRRDVLRRVGFIQVAQEAQLSLEEIGELLAQLPADRAPTRREWASVAQVLRPRLDAKIEVLRAEWDALEEG